MLRIISKLSVFKPTPHTGKFKTLNVENRMTSTVAKRLGDPVSTTSKCSQPSRQPQHTCDNFIVDKCDIFEVPRPNSRPYHKLSYCMIPLIVALAYNVFFSSGEEEREAPQYIPYEYMYRRTKRFAWGDGRKSFFHGPLNLIPDEQTYNPEKIPNAVDEDLNRRKALRDQHAQEELERRRRRHEGQA